MISMIHYNINCQKIVLKFDNVFCIKKKKIQVLQKWKIGETLCELKEKFDVAMYNNLKQQWRINETHDW